MKIVITDELIPEDMYLMNVKAYFHKLPFLTNVSMPAVVTISYLASLGCIMFMGLKKHLCQSFKACTMVVKRHIQYGTFWCGLLMLISYFA